MQPATRSNFIIDESEDLPLSVAPKEEHSGHRNWISKLTPGARPPDRGGPLVPDARSASVSKPPSRVAALEIHEALLCPALLDPAAGELEFVHPIPLWRRRWMVFIFSLTASLLFADQNLLAPNLSMAADFFGFDDNERDSKLGGFIMAAFFITGAPAALLVGWLTDRVNRRNLLFFVIILGEAPCLGTYWVTEYWQFFLLRTLTGISVGGCFPLVYSLLGDLFPISKRNVVSASVALSTGAGVGVGQALAGYIGPATGDWRVPFMVVAAPALIVAVVMLLTCHEPPRGAFEEALQGQYATGVEYTETITWPKVKVLLRIPSNIIIITQGIFGSLPWGMLLTFLNDYLATPLPNGQGLGVHTATLLLITFGLAGAIGVVCGGLGGQYLYNRRKEYLPIMMFCSVFSGTAPMYYLVNAPLTKVPLAVTFCIISFSGCCAGVAGPNLRAVILNVNEPETRGVALALQSMTDDVGKGLGPVFVAIFIQVLGRRKAFNVAIAGWYPCALMLGALYWHIRRDEDRMQERLQLRAGAAAPATAAATVMELDVMVPHGSGKPYHLDDDVDDDEPGGAVGSSSGKQHRSDSVRLLSANDSHLAGGGGGGGHGSSDDAPPDRPGPPLPPGAASAGPSRSRLAADKAPGLAAAAAVAAGGTELQQTFSGGSSSHGAPHDGVAGRSSSSATGHPPPPPLFNSSRSRQGGDESASSLVSKSSHDADTPLADGSGSGGSGGEVHHHVGHSLEGRGSGDAGAVPRARQQQQQLQQSLKPRADSNSAALRTNLLQAEDES